MIAETDTQRSNRQWRDTYRERKEKVLSDPKYKTKYNGMWNYRLSFHANDTEIVKAIPKDGAIYRVSFMYNSRSRFMGSVVLPALSMTDAYHYGGAIAKLAGSPLMTRIAVKEVDSRLLQRDHVAKANIKAILPPRPDDFLFQYAKMLLQHRAAFSVNREEVNHLFLGSVVLHIPMLDNPTDAAEAVLDALPVDKAHYKIESLGLFVERYCRNSYGPRYTAPRMARELSEFKFSLQSCQFCFDQNIQDSDFKDWLTWPDPLKSFQDRYKYKNELVDFYAKLSDLDVFVDVDQSKKVAA